MTERRESYAGQVPLTRIEEMEETIRCQQAALDGCHRLIARLMSDNIADAVAHPLAQKYVPVSSDDERATPTEARARQMRLLASLEPGRWYKVKDFRQHDNRQAIDDLKMLYVRGYVTRQRYNPTGGRPLYEYARREP